MDRWVHVVAKTSNMYVCLRIDSAPNLELFQLVYSVIFVEKLA